MHGLTPVLVAALMLTSAAAAGAQPPDAPVRADPDARLDPLQPDFTLAALPTTLRVAAGRSAFRVTHRFTRALNQGDVGDLLANAFGLDSSAVVGLEFRYGLRPGTQLAIHRTSDRTIQIFTQHSVLTQRDGSPIGLDALITLEGDDNLSEHHQSALGVVVSRQTRRAVLYTQPLLMINSNRFAGGDQHTLLVGLGARLRVGSSVYVVAEFAPRLAGHDPGRPQFSAAIERRVGGHGFQLNVSNGFGTTLGQMARGTLDYDHWYLGFNISRKFY